MRGPYRSTVRRVSDLVSYSLEGKTAVITMDDGKANALSNQMIDGLLAALARAEQEASAIVLAGRPDRFCAGFDLRVMMSGPAQAVELLKLGSKLLLALYRTPLPLIIAATGHSLAGGALVVLTGDYRIGAAGAFKIGLNEVAIGLPVPVLAMELARDRLSRRALHHATLGAQIYDPETALAVGYFDAVVPADELAARARAEATRLGAFGRLPFKATKERLRGATIALIEGSLDKDLANLLPGS
jgi:enoyl-CoA hydratase